jgi:hypothetical protein
MGLLFAFAFSACAKKQNTALSVDCVSSTPPKTAGSTGSALVFVPDPEVASGNPHLSPTSMNLDDYRSAVTLSHLGGLGILEGQYVDVRDGLFCNGGFGAQSSNNQFEYIHADPRFQEAMAYYDGDLYRAHIDSIGYLATQVPVEIVAHCMLDDNAFYFRSQVNGVQVGNVCLGDSAVTEGASYSDDAQVTTHELQHASTTDAYDLKQDLNRFWYDEAGSMNEAISDFMALSFTEPLISSSFDPRTFSRWALGTFIPGETNTRGAQKCPTYDSQFGNDCSNYPDFSGGGNTISYVYPDGVGWPYANNFTGPNYAGDAFVRFGAQEEIHNAGVLMEGALWDVFAAIMKSRSNGPAAQGAVTALVLEAVKHLPKPSFSQQSPVSFRGLAQNLVDFSSDPGLGFSPSEQTAISDALTARGLIGGTQVPSGWATVGTGSSASPGVRIEDNPVTLKKWLSAMGADPSQVTQGIAIGINGRLDPGETVAIWFDISNTSAMTAGGVNVTLSTSDGDVIKVLDGNTNIGASTPTSAQIQYGKIYGTATVAKLNPTVPAGASYFRTNPGYFASYYTAIWLKVSSAAAHGRVVTLHLDLAPSNGAQASVDFPVRIN